jgi:hypothetical protein
MSTEISERDRYQATRLEKELVSIEKQNRRWLKELALPQDLTKLKNILVADGNNESDKNRRAWSIFYVLAIALPKVRRFAEEGNAFLAARWTLRAGLGGEAVRYTARGIVADRSQLKASRSAKYCRGIQTYIQDLVKATPRLTEGQLWWRLPAEESAVDVVAFDRLTYEVYRRRDNVVQVDHKGRQRSIVRCSLGPYLRRARTFLRSIADTT